MNIEYKDFIGFYRNVYPEGYCQHLIKEFERLESEGAGSSRQSSENALAHHKNDFQIFCNVKNHSIEPFEGRDSVGTFFDGLQVGYDHYINKFSVLKNSGEIKATSMKMQRTSPGGGYHVWHSEQGGGNGANRVLVYLLYLNTLLQGGNGETEFLYQEQRVEPEENLLLFWPAAYTHPHRGNPVYNNNFKYIVTGWFYYE